MLNSSISEGTTMLGDLPTGLIIVIFLFVLIIVVAITCGILRLCKKEDYVEGRPTYSVAISNRLFKEKSSNEISKLFSHHCCQIIQNVGGSPGQPAL